MIPGVVAWRRRGGMVEVPVMTGHTTPSGECFASTERNSSQSAWHAFDGDDSTSWSSGYQEVSSESVGYDFGFPVSVREMTLLGPGNSTTPNSFQVYYSDNGLSWGIAFSGNHPDPNVNPNAVTYTLPDTGKHRRWRLSVITNHGSSSFIWVNRLQFRGFK